MQTLAGIEVKEHTCTGIDCYPCLQAEIDAAGARLEAHRVKKFDAKTKRGHSAVSEARPVATQTINHVAGDVPTPREMLRGAVIVAGGAVALLNTAAAVAAEDRAPLQAPLAADWVAAPAHLADPTIARGFIMAGNAYFTVRSQKTGTRYTYRVSRAKCTRCGKLDCACWAYPTYFVALLTGPDNTGDYTYLGMLRQGAFQLTRASKMNDAALPVKAFRWVWDALYVGRYPAQVELWHEGRCGRCGRMLTVPESVERGIGPDCAAKGGL